jgi:hypothetical protein
MQVFSDLVKNCFSGEGGVDNRWEQTQCQERRNGECKRKQLFKRREKRLVV